MSRKVKCANCINASGFAIPMRVGSANYDYAKHVLGSLKRVLYCKEIGKTKPIEHEQYCKYYKKSEYYFANQSDIEKLETMIAEYEKQIVS